ncbi:hypothetical protein [Baekduia sp. Peel2402]|uniref:hypothetical protein n=1 Tax=Baekduia sp. Peel2402 TaxID=3458296 RepID=UPI00403E5F09
MTHRSSARARAAILLVVALGVLGPASAEAAVDWAAPTMLSTPTVDAGDGVLAVNEQGRAIAAWDEESGNGVVAVSVRDFRSWSTPLVVSSPANGGLSPAVAIDPQGTAIVVWVESAPGSQTSTTYARVRHLGVWGPRETVSSEGNRAYVIMDSAGRATVVQLYGIGDSPGDGLFARRRSLDGQWEAPQRVSTAMRAGLVKLDVDLAGDVAVGWSKSGNTELWVNERTAGGGWGTPLQLGNGNASAITLAKSPLSDSTAIGACYGAAPCTLTLWTRAVGTTAWVANSPTTRSPSVPSNLQVVGVGPAPLGGDKGGYLATNALTSTAGDIFGTWTTEAPIPLYGKLGANQEARAIIAGVNGSQIVSSDLFPGGTWNAATPVPTITGLFAPTILALGVDRAGHGTLLWTDQSDETDAPRQISATLGAGTDPDPDPGVPSPTPPTAPPANPGTPGPSAPAAPSAPGAKAGGATTQKAGNSVAVTVSCPDAACTVDASGTMSAPGAAKVYKLTSIRGRRLAKGAKATLKVKLPAAARSAARKALARHHKVSVTIRITVRPAAGGTAKVLTRKIRLKR